LKRRYVVRVPVAELRIVAAAAVSALIAATPLSWQRSGLGCVAGNQGRLRITSLLRIASLLWPFLLGLTLLPIVTAVAALLR
jgi:hypothetical protein